LTPYLEIGGDYREVVPGIHMLELPLPFSLGIVNVWLVRLESGWLLIDTGMQTEACFDALARALEGLSVDWRDIRRILLTHIHPDHMGLASKLIALTGAPLDLHRADHELLAHVTDTDLHRDWQQEILTTAGVSPEMRALVHSSMFEIQQSFERLTPDRLLCGGETIATAHGALEVIWTPGHSPGHVCLYDRERRVLISGDHILQHISPNIGWQPGRDALGEFLSSLDRIAALDVDLILPSHGAPFHRPSRVGAQDARAPCRTLRAYRGAGGWRRDHRPPDRRAAVEPPPIALPLPVCDLRSDGAPGVSGAARGPARRPVGQRAYGRPGRRQKPIVPHGAARCNYWRGHHGNVAGDCR
jgi:glyoxylase-like metal-dependent hydrolase (beta-lactamase superfamily II)